MIKNVNTGIYSVSHFLMDFMCHYYVFSLVLTGFPGRAVVLFLLYNVIAFALQCPIGALCDRFKGRYSVTFSFLLLLTGFCIGFWWFQGSFAGCITGMVVCAFANAFRLKVQAARKVLDYQWTHDLRYLDEVVREENDLLKAFHPGKGTRADANDARTDLHLLHIELLFRPWGNLVLCVIVGNRDVGALFAVVDYREGDTVERPLGVFAAGALGLVDGLCPSGRKAEEEHQSCNKVLFHIILGILDSIKRLPAQHHILNWM